MASNINYELELGRATLAIGMIKAKIKRTEKEKAEELRKLSVKYDRQIAELHTELDEVEKRQERFAAAMVAQMGCGKIFYSPQKESPQKHGVTVGENVESIYSGVDRKVAPALLERGERGDGQGDVCLVPSKLRPKTTADIVTRWLDIGGQDAGRDQGQGMKKCNEDGDGDGKGGTNKVSAGTVGNVRRECNQMDENKVSGETVGNVGRECNEMDEMTIDEAMAMLEQDDGSVVTEKKAGGKGGVAKRSKSVQEKSVQGSAIKSPTGEPVVVVPKAGELDNGGIAVAMLEEDYGSVVTEKKAGGKGGVAKRSKPVQEKSVQGSAFKSPTGEPVVVVPKAGELDNAGIAVDVQDGQLKNVEGGIGGNLLADEALEQSDVDGGHSNEDDSELSNDKEEEKIDNDDDWDDHDVDDMILSQMDLPDEASSSNNAKLKYDEQCELVESVPRPKSGVKRAVVENAMEARNQVHTAKDGDGIEEMNGEKGNINVRKRKGSEECMKDRGEKEKGKEGNKSQKGGSVKNRGEKEKGKEGSKSQKGGSVKSVGKKTKSPAQKGNRENPNRVQEKMNGGKAKGQVVGRKSHRTSKI